LLRDHQSTYRVCWDLPVEEGELIAAASAVGQTSRAIGLTLGKDPSYIRHVRSKIAHGLGDATRTRGPMVKDGHLRFPGEHGPGIPASLNVDDDLAALLGYYCAEGCVVRSRKRPNSHVVNFSFSHQEVELAERVRALLRKCLGVEGRLVLRATTLGVAAGKASAALLLK